MVCDQWERVSHPEHPEKTRFIHKLTEIPFDDMNVKELYESELPTYYYDWYRSDLISTYEDGPIFYVHRPTKGKLFKPPNWLVAEMWNEWSLGEEHHDGPVCYIHVPTWLTSKQFPDWTKMEKYHQWGKIGNYYVHSSTKHKQSRPPTKDDLDWFHR